MQQTPLRLLQYMACWHVIVTSGWSCLKLTRYSMTVIFKMTLLKTAVEASKKVLKLGVYDEKMEIMIAHIMRLEALQEGDYAKALSFSKHIKDKDLCEIDEKALAAKIGGLLYDYRALRAHASLTPNGYKEVKEISLNLMQALMDTQCYSQVERAQDVHFKDSKISKGCVF